MHARRIHERTLKRPHRRLAEVVLAAFLFCGFIGIGLNLQFLQERTNELDLVNLANQRARDQWVSPLSQAFVSCTSYGRPGLRKKAHCSFVQNKDNAAEHARNLIIVAGHSVTASGHLEDADKVSPCGPKNLHNSLSQLLAIASMFAPHILHVIVCNVLCSSQDELDWFLLPYQKHSGLPNAIVAHIKAGIMAAQRDRESLLVFSGGETRPAAGPDTEGSSYFRVADAMLLWSEGSNVRSRTLAEEFARDSFENLYVVFGLL